MDDFPNSSGYFYKRVINCLNEEGLHKCLNKLIFIEYLYAVLATWGMDRLGGGPKLIKFKDFKRLIQDNSAEIIKLANYELNKVREYELQEVLIKLGKLFDSLNIMKSEEHLVGTSKLLHNLLPHLVLPIDGTYTLPFFYGTKFHSKIEQKNIFLEIIKQGHHICKIRKLNSKDLKYEWDTSIPKLIDNTIIAKVKFDKRKVE
jgi:hypothetical protein